MQLCCNYSMCQIRLFPSIYFDGLGYYVYWRVRVCSISTCIQNRLFGLGFFLCMMCVFYAVLCDCGNLRDGTISWGDITRRNLILIWKKVQKFLNCQKLQHIRFFFDVVSNLGIVEQPQLSRRGLTRIYAVAKKLRIFSQQQGGSSVADGQRRV